MTHQKDINEWVGLKAHIGGWLLNSPLRKIAELTILGNCSALLQEKILAQLHGNESVLDIGAGSGYYSLRIAKKLTDGKVYCLDASGDMLSILTKKATKRGLNDHVIPITGDATSSGLMNDSMDVVVSFALFHELPEPELVIDEMVRVLKPGGTFVIGDFTKKFTHYHPNAHGGWEEAELSGLMKMKGITDISVTLIKKWLFAYGVK